MSEDREGKASASDSSAAWEAFLSPDVVRSKLITGGMFLVGYETLIASITEHLVSFFANHWTAEGPQISEKYKKEVLGRDPKSKGDRLRGSIAWLRENDVISEDDETAIRTVTEARNRVAHELVGFVAGSKSLDYMEHFGTLQTLVEKIERWWIVNVELATDPDFDDVEVDPEQIVSGPSLMMQVLVQVALGTGEGAWEFHRGFTNGRKDRSE